MRLKTNVKIVKNCKGDTMSILPGNPKLGTEDVKIRVVKVDLPNGNEEYLATNIFDSDITPSMFRELYFYRWPIEVKYRELKTRLCLEEFSGTSTVSIMQEFYINVLLSNLASLIKNEADNNLQIPAESANKHRYQSNRSFIIGCFKELLPKILCSILKPTCIDRLYKETLRTKGKVLPGRSYPRKKLKLVCRKHSNNKKVAF